MTQHFKSETRHCENWAVTIYRNEDPPGFYTKCISPIGDVLSTEVYDKKGSAWQEGYKLVDKVVREHATRRYNEIALPLTLSLLYVSGKDNHLKSNNDQNKFIDRSANKGYDFNILNLLENQGLIETQKDRRKTKLVYLTKNLFLIFSLGSKSTSQDS